MQTILLAMAEMCGMVQKERKRRRRTKDEIRPARSVASVAVYSGPSPMDGTRDTGSSLMRCGSSPPHFVV